MKHVLLIAAGLALVLAAPAQAKGPLSATITGPGLDRPITVDGSALNALVGQSQFAAAVMGPPPGPALSRAPSGELGPKYVATYLIPSPEAEFRVRQHLYPYAGGGPVAYIPPAQTVFGTTTHGGWYRAAPELEATLVAAGLPKEPTRSALDWRAALAAAALAPLAFGAFVASRRRRS